MKILINFLVTFFILLFCHAQEKGVITSEKMGPQAGDINKYFYTPPKRLVVPAKIQAAILYKQKQEFFERLIPVRKINNRYVFSFKTPDSVSVLIIGIVDAAIDQSVYNGLSRAIKKNVDNNNGQGFVFYISNNKGLRFIDEQMELADLIYNYARYRLDVKVKNTSLINMYETTYKAHPQLKDEKEYLNYLTILFDERGDAVKSKLLAYAGKMINAENDELKWLEARDIYQMLKMDKEQGQTEEKILQTFPSGELAMQNFWHRYYAKEWNMPHQVLAFMNEYAANFNDTSGKTRDDFYGYIISILLKQKQWDSCKKYMQFISNKNGLAFSFDNIAWELSGKQLDNNGSDLKVAVDISKQSLQWVEEDIKNHISDTEREIYEGLVGAKIKYTNTYALILYKLGLYDSAFFYQDNIYKQQDVMLDVGSIERYAAYAEKIKGKDYCKKLIEEKLLKGINSPGMLKQLQSIYKQSGLNENEFLKIQKENNRFAIEKKQQVIKAKLGSVKAPKFSLENIKEQTVDLSTFRGKIVILDFWATWCTPCVGSFPKMQKLVNKYSSDSSIVFLFIDVLERKSKLLVKKQITKMMEAEKYTFTILLDTDSKASTAYNITGIPAKFVIDKNGNIIFMNDSLEEMELVIENERKYE